MRYFALNSKAASSAKIMVPSTITTSNIGVDSLTIRVLPAAMKTESPSLGATSSPHEAS